MANDQDVQITVGQEIIQPVIQAKIQAAIVRELGKTGDMLEIVVAKALSMKVDENGKTDSYRKDFTWIEIMCKQHIQAAAKAAMVEWLEKNKDVIQLQLQKQFKKNSSAICKAMADAMEANLKTSWGFTCNMNFAHRN